LNNPDRSGQPARLAALKALGAIGRGQRAEEALHQALAGSDLDRRDRALATELVYGVCRWRGLLDHYLASLSTRPLAKLDPEILDLLRLGGYQLLKLDRVPDRAAVHTTVELAKRRTGQAKAGFVNAVLRALARAEKRPSLPHRDRDLAGHLAAALSHPRWLVERWLRELGEEEAEALLRADNLPPGLCLRINPLVIGRDQAMALLAKAGAEARPGLYSPQAVYAPGLSRAEAEGLLPAKAAAPQAEAAQVVGLVVGPRPGERVLDLCAGVGGKTTHLAELMEGRGLITAVDLSPDRVRTGRAAAEQRGLGMVRYLQADATARPIKGLDPEPFQAVLVDAPCTGSGTLGPRPDLRWRLGPPDPARMAALQSRLLLSGAGLTASGGRLVYATCSLFAEENQEVVEAFLAAHPDFSLEDPRPFLAPSLRPLADPRGWLQTRPQSHGLDGFFVARMVRSPG